MVCSTPSLLIYLLVNILSKVSCFYSQHYGEVPDYLQQRNEEERQAQEEYDNFVREQRERGAMNHLSDEKRQVILQVLEHIAAQ